MVFYEGATSTGKGGVHQNGRNNITVESRFSPDESRSATGKVLETVSSGSSQNGAGGGKNEGGKGGKEKTAL